MPRPSFPTTVRQFTALFSTGDARQSYLDRRRWPDGFVCVRCGSLHGWRIVRAGRSRARSAPPQARRCAASSGNAPTATSRSRELGYAHERRVQGDLRKPGAVGVVPVVHNTIRNLKGWLNGTHHGVGRPHLQADLDEFVFRYNRRANLELAFRTLLGLGSQHAPVRTTTILGAQDLPSFRYPDEDPQPVL